MLRSEQWISEQDKEELLLPAWQRLVDLMAELCNTPAGFIVQANDDKYKVIIANESIENPYSAGVTIDSDVNLFCKEVVRQDSCLYIGNATEQPDWLTNPEVSEDGFNTYLGYPLHWPDGSVFGTICVMDFAKTDYDERYHKLVEHFRDMAERELDLLDQNIQLECTALNDDLTNLYNRKGFFLAAEQLIKTAKSDSALVSVFYFDIDNLKYINDNFGHQVGDKIISSFAKNLKKTYREVDVMARFGGDEFVVICQKSTPIDISIIINRLTELIDSEKPYPAIAFSYGVASANANKLEALSLEHLIKQADDAMYKNKCAKKANF